MITHGLGWIQLALNFFETDVAVSSGLNPERSAEHTILHLHCSTGRGCQSNTMWITTFVKTVQDAERRVTQWRDMGLSKFE